MQDHAMEDRHGIRERKRAKAPWIVRIVLLLGALIQFLARSFWRLSRRNVPLSLGMALFAVLFAAVAYNAFFRQNMMARPVLFSTRGAPMPAAQKHPFVEKAISTEALSNKHKTVPAPPARAAQSHDAIADFIAAQGKTPAVKTTERKAPVAIPDAKPRAKTAAPQAR